MSMKCFADWRNKDGILYSQFNGMQFFANPSKTQKNLTVHMNGQFEYTISRLYFKDIQ